MLQVKLNNNLFDVHASMSHVMPCDSTSLFFAAHRCHEEHQPYMCCFGNKVVYLLRRCLHHMGDSSPEQAGPFSGLIFGLIQIDPSELCEKSRSYIMTIVTEKIQRLSTRSQDATQ